MAPGLKKGLESEKAYDESPLLKKICRVARRKGNPCSKLRQAEVEASHEKRFWIFGEAILSHE